MWNSNPSEMTNKSDDQKQESESPDYMRALRANIRTPFLTMLLVSYLTHLG